MKYPEHEKLQAVKSESQTIGEFIEYSGYTLCKIVDDEFVPSFKPIEEVLAEYFEIDLDKIEKEKRHMLEGCRIANG